MSNPSKPIIVYNGLEYEYENAFLFESKLIMKPEYGQAIGTYEYKILDLSDPKNPRFLNTFKSDSKLIELKSLTLGVGSYYFHDESYSIVKGDITSSLQTQAIIVGDVVNGYQGSFGNYYIFDNKLWKLLE